jgi:PAS domain S-box-containing protein
VSRVSDNLTRLVDSTTSPILAVDPERAIVEWNKAMQSLTGLRRDAASSMTLEDWCELVCGSDRESAALMRAVETVSHGSDQSAEVQVTTGSPTRTLVFTITGRVESDGRLGAVLFGHDITARLEAESVRSENLALARSARLKDEFLAGMSHELRTPLNAVIGLSSVLRRRTFGDLTEKQESYLGQIEASGQHLLGLINDVLDLAKLDAEKLEIDLEACVLESVVSEAVDLVRPMAARGGVSVAPVPHTSHLVLGDRRRLRQILVNLCSNAVKFTEPGGEMGVEVETGGDHVAVTVWDTGVGIDRSKLNLLFEPFQQVDGSLSREREGSGLGLAIASKLASLHHASIEVDSVPGRGSRFTVRLPVAEREATEEFSAAAAG